VRLGDFDALRRLPKDPHQERLSGAPVSSSRRVDEDADQQLGPLLDLHRREPLLFLTSEDPILR
jgi:hypothetical protein